MWIAKTATEIADEDRRDRQRQVRWNRLIVLLVYVACCTLAVIGVRVVAPYEVVISGGSHRSPVLRAVIVAILMLPFAWILHRFLPRGGRQVLESLTVCPACERRGLRDAGQACPCGGGAMCALATVRWVE